VWYNNEWEARGKIFIRESVILDDFKNCTHSVLFCERLRVRTHVSIELPRAYYISKKFRSPLRCSHVFNLVLCSEEFAKHDGF